MSTAEPQGGKGLRTGYTTGACAAAAAKAATRCLVRDTALTEIETTLPNRTRATFALKRCERLENRAVCSVIKDAGDDPDCTHGAELVAEVELRPEAGIEIDGGEGIARVTKPGLGLEVGALAITPIPRRNLIAMVEEGYNHRDTANMSRRSLMLKIRNRHTRLTRPVISPIMPATPGEPKLRNGCSLGKDISGCCPRNLWVIINRKGDIR